MDTNLKGVLTELSVQQAFLKKGFGVSIPINPSSRYDLIVDAFGGLFKVQVKTASPDNHNSGFTISTCSTHKIQNKWVHTPYSHDEVDLFATSFNGKVYVIPQSDVGNRTEMFLRTVPAVNNINTINYADKYELDNIVNTMLPYNE